MDQHDRVTLALVDQVQPRAVQVHPVGGEGVGGVIQPGDLGSGEAGGRLDPLEDAGEEEEGEHGHLGRVGIW